MPDGTGRTIGEWDELLHQRRRDMWLQIPDPFPMMHRHIFRHTEDTPGSPQVFYYVNGSRCSTSVTDNPYGVVVCLPTGSTSTDEPADLVKRGVHRSYPNPFNESISINYLVENNGMVEIQIFNIMGKLMKTLVHEYQVPGEYSINWNGEDEFNRKVLPGIYIQRIDNAGDVSINEIVKLD